ncbi:substrate-binding domain-containing protein [Bifidobacterium sp.]|uniref:substrate-binding domain-containing protein n=1 Tax=Bifidobacterium sp. TaxID=41200 RepID=UPI0039ECAFAF
MKYKVKDNVRKIAVSTIAMLSIVSILSGCQGTSFGSSSSSSAKEESEISKSDAADDKGLDKVLTGKTVGVATVGTQHFWDREAFNGAIDEVKKLGGKVITTDGGRDNTVNAQNHEKFLTAKVDAVITILGDSSVDPYLKRIKAAGIPIFSVQHPSQYVVNDVEDDAYQGGKDVGKIVGKDLNGKGQIALFNAFESSLSYCSARAKGFKEEIKKEYPGIKIIEPELAEKFSSPADDARQQTLNLLQKYAKGTLSDIHVACWDQPAIGVVQAIKESGRSDVKVSAYDAGPDTLKIMQEKNSPFVANVAQQPRLQGHKSAVALAKYIKGEKVEKTTYVESFPVDGSQEAAAIYKKLGYDKTAD